MGIKRVINTDFWKDDVVAEQYSAEDRYFMLYLLSNPNTKQCGIYHLPVRTIAFEMGYKESAAQAILDRFCTHFHNVVYNPETKEIAILNFLKHSIVKGGKPVEDCIRQELTQIKDASLINVVYIHMLPYMDKHIELAASKQIPTVSMYVGIKNVFKDFININDNDNENERIVTRIVPRIVEPINEPLPDSDDLFEKFYSAYPRKVAKSEAKKSFKKLKPTDELLTKMLSAIEIQKQSKQWQTKEYIPHPATWLNQKRWEDETDEPQNGAKLIQTGDNSFKLE